MQMRRAYRYFMAFAIILAALGLRWLLQPWLGEGMPFVTIVAGLAVIVWLAGVGPAVMAAVLGYIGAILLFSGARVLGAGAVAASFVGAVSYFASSGVVIGLGMLMVQARRRSQEATDRIRATDVRLNVVGAAARMFTWETNHQAKTIWWSEGAASIIGCDPKELSTDAMQSHFFMAPEDSPRVWEEFNKAVNAKQQEYTIEFRRRDHQRWFMVHASILYGEQGEPIRVIGVTQDVTERKSAQLALADTAQRLARERERLAVALRTGKLGVYEWEIGQNEVWWSPETYPVFGVDPATFRPTIEAFSALIHPDDRAELWRRTEECIKKRQEFVHEYRIIQPNGEVRWVANRSHVSLDAQGNVQRLTGVAADVTEEHRTQAALQASNDTFRHLVEKSPFGIYVVDADFKLVEVSQGAEKVFQRVTPLIGRDFAEVIRLIWQEPFASKVIELFRRTLATGEPYHSPSTVEKRADSKEVESYDWKLERLTLPDGRYGVVCHFYDLSERQRYEAALRESEQRFKVMADTAPAMLWITEADGRCSFLSRGWLEYTGQEEEKALGFGWLEAVHPDDMADSRRVFLEANARQEPFAIEHRVRTAAGEYRWLLDAGRPRFSKDGQFLGFIGSVIDVHEQRVASDSLKEADRRKDEFLATLSHELRNPLAPIRTAIQMLKMKQAADDDVLWGRDVIERQVAQMSRLLDDLLDVSRITRNKLQLRMMKVALAGVVESAVETSRPLIDGNSHTLTVLLPAEAVWVRGDPLRLAQVFANLLNNAAKYTPPGGKIELRASVTDDQVTVSVKDNGIGMTKEVQANLFQMFWQADTALHRSNGGLGIGLSLVKGLVGKHGGTVEAFSEGAGKGTEFSVRLPRLVGATDSEDDGPTVNGHAWRKRRLLVVDDLKDGAESLARLLRLLGHEVDVAHNGEDAIAAAEKDRPDVILLDIGMPKMNGYDVCREIRRRAWGYRPAIVALTGWGQEEDRRRSQEAGFDYHLVKPVDPAKLSVVIEQLPARDTVVTE